MSEGLDVIIVDDEVVSCEIISGIVSRFYVWGDLLCFTNPTEALSYCLNRDVGIAIFIVEVFMREMSGFHFLESVKSKFLTVHEDAIMVTARANDDIVNVCVASELNYLLEKPMAPYTLQLAVRAIAGKYLKFARILQSAIPPRPQILSFVSERDA